jgi:hypothetical protein
VWVLYEKSGCHEHISVLCDLCVLSILSVFYKVSLGLMKVRSCFVWHVWWRVCLSGVYLSAAKLVCVIQVSIGSWTESIYHGES